MLKWQVICMVKLGGGSVIPSIWIFPCTHSESLLPLHGSFACLWTRMAFDISREAPKWRCLILLCIIGLQPAVSRTEVVLVQVAWGPEHPHPSSAGHRPEDNTSSWLGKTTPKGDGWAGEVRGAGGGGNTFLGCKCPLLSQGFINGWEILSMRLSN